MLFIITITMAGLSMVVLHALERNPWGTFAVGITIPIAMGLVCIIKNRQFKAGDICGIYFADVWCIPWAKYSRNGTR